MMAMYVYAQAVRWVGDEPFPGLVEIQITDASGKVHTLVDKAAMFDRGHVLRKDSSYPLEVMLACVLVEKLVDTARISLARPWGLETTEGVDELEVRLSQTRVDG
jgi:hypothetical protein